MTWNLVHEVEGHREIRWARVLMAGVVSYAAGVVAGALFDLAWRSFSGDPMIESLAIFSAPAVAVSVVMWMGVRRQLRDDQAGQALATTTRTVDENE